MGGRTDWDKAFTASQLKGRVGEVTAYAAATLATEMLCLLAANPQRMVTD